MALVGHSTESIGAIPSTTKRRCAKRLPSWRCIRPAVAKDLLGHQTTSIFERYAIRDQPVYFEAITKLALVHELEAKAAAEAARDFTIFPPRRFPESKRSPAITNALEIRSIPMSEATKA
jgi:hypothetical protein